jgi:ParB family chromosome partitioning protein
MKDEIKLIPIDQIRILNPRHRDPKKFEIIIQSIRSLGLKKPIQVSLRTAQEAEGPGYDLVCGQGRIEAFKALGHTEIPAIIVEVSKEERLLRSLVENMARRFPKPIDLLREIERLKTAGYSQTDVGKKLDISASMVSGFLSLKRAGEERLLQAALTGRIPISVAMDIARTDGIEAQRALLDAYEKKEMNQDAIRAVKRLIAHRRFLGKAQNPNDGNRKTTPDSAKSLVKAYKREGERLKLLIRKARLCESKLAVVVTAFNKLFDDGKFRNLLKSESLISIPKNLCAKLAVKHQDFV